MVNHDPIMEAIQKTATKTASCLSKTVAAETVDFIVNTSVGPTSFITTNSQRDHVTLPTFESTTFNHRSHSVSVLN